MTDREKLIELLGGDMCKDVYCYDCEYENNDRACIEHIKQNMADHLLANGVTFQKWIPVSERLPEDENSYLVVVEYKYSFEKELNREVDVAIHRFECGYIDNRWDTFIDWDEGQSHLHVTHWMPLPEPPNEG